MIKKLVAIIATAVMLLNCGMTAFGFTFPEPDWGALLAEKEGMVTKTEFELYAEGPLDASPYFGAKLEPKSGAYIGSIAETSDKLKPLSIYLTYIEDMFQDDLYYPANTMIKEENALAVVGWTINDLANVDFAQVRKVLDNLNKYNKPMFIRVANEMNCSAIGDEPSLYIEIFRKIADMIHEYPNFAVVWSPIDIGSLDRPFEYYYPGDEYVDWVGISSYVMKYFQGNQSDYKSSVYFMTGEYGWSTNKVKPFMDFLQRNGINKPVMISEGGVATSHSNGEEYQSWTEPRLRNMMWYLIMKYPQIKMINYFDIYRNYEMEKYNISDYGYAINIFNEAKNSGAYITEYGASPEFVFTQANSAGTLTAENGVVSLYTLAHFPGYYDYVVNYFIDGSWYGASAQIPYKCDINLDDISDGMHTLTISTLGTSKDYTLYKRGRYIRFGAEPDAADSKQNIKVIVNGNEVEFDQHPIIMDDRTLVPVRAIFEALGADVNWNSETRIVTAERWGVKITLAIGSNILYVDGKETVLDVPAQIVGDRTLVPVRAISESFGCTVKWNGDTRTVTIED